LIILEGHTGNVTCLNFDSKGNILISYSSVDLSVRLWKIGNKGFFSTPMGGTGKCIKEVKLDPLPNHITNPHILI
jgi:WD40 repeat protein